MDFKPQEIFSMYTDDLKLNILYVNKKVSTISCKTKEELNALIKHIKDEAKKHLINLEVYNGLDEAKSNRRLHDLCDRSN